MEGEDYENKKDNLQSASGMPGILGIFCGRANVYADQKQALSATVTLLKQEKDCVVQVEAKNSGADFTGKVRLVFSGTDNSNGCAFEQRLTLPQNGKNSIQ